MPRWQRWWCAGYLFLSSIVAADGKNDIPLQPHNSDDPSAYDYLIIHYHKTGHEIAYRLTSLIKDEPSIEQFTSVRHDPLPKRDHDPMTNCPRVDLRRGMLNVQAAPNFFCDAHILAEELLRGAPTKKGIKIVHLVRDPFRLAISNYKYHAQRPTPEKWVKGFDVCAAEEDPINYAELLMPTLESNGVMTYQDFDIVLNMCHSLFRTHAGLESADYYKHLLELEPVKGLFLATTQLLRGRLGDLTRMANNILKLEQLQQLETHYNLAGHHLISEKRIQLLTLATDDFIQRPGETAMRFLDFILGHNSPREVKESIAAKYEQSYLELKESGSSRHITSWGSDTAMLESSLREHEFFGRVLSNIQHIVENTLGAGSEREH